jgi:hypothetical protein
VRCKGPREGCVGGTGSRLIGAGPDYGSILFGGEVDVFPFRGALA